MMECWWSHLVQVLTPDHVVYGPRHVQKTVLKMCLILNMYVYVTHGNQKRASDPKELELWTVVSQLTWTLGTELRSSRSVASAHIC